VWSDTLQHAEQIHFLRVCFWGGLSTVAGTGLLLVALTSRRASAMILRFATVCTAFGVLELLLGGIGYRSTPLRDVASATRLDRMSWLFVGLDLGLAAVGLVLMSSWYWSPRVDAAASKRCLSAVGAGVATLLHGLALATLQLLLIAVISR
jgi:hypothetical protein